MTDQQPDFRPGPGFEPPPSAEVPAAPASDAEAPGDPAPEYPTPPSAPENVARGLLFSLGGVVAGVALTAIIWKFGVQWAFTSFVLAAASVYLYKVGSGGAVRRGVWPLVVVIVLGTALSFFTCVAVDAYDYFTAEGLDGSVWAFVADNVFYPPVLAGYGREIAFFLLFAALGTWSTLRALVRGQRA